MGINFREMVNHAKKAGVANEQTMWESIDGFSDLLEELKESHPHIYWKFMRNQHGIMFHNHYDECFAVYDVGQMHSTNKEGKENQGAHWTCEQIEEATAGKKFPAGTSKWDKFVAFNASFHDWNKYFEDADILEIGYAFYFADEDWGDDTKVWEYISHRPTK